METELTGRDLEKALGVALDFKPSYTWEILNADETATMIGFEGEAAARKWYDEHPSVHATHHIGTWEMWPMFSESIEAAFKVVQKMGAMGWQLVAINPRKIGSHADNNVRTWHVSFTNLRCDEFIAESDNLSEAICCAALAALNQQLTR